MVEILNCIADQTDAVRWPIAGSGQPKPINWRWLHGVNPGGWFPADTNPYTLARVHFDNLCGLAIDQLRATVRDWSHPAYGVWIDFENPKHRLLGNANSARLLTRLDLTLRECGMPATAKMVLAPGNSLVGYQGPAAVGYYLYHVRPRNVTPDHSWETRRTLARLQWEASAKYRQGREVVALVSPTLQTGFWGGTPDTASMLEQARTWIALAGPSVKVGLYADHKDGGMMLRTAAHALQGLADDVNHTLPGDPA